MNIGEIVRELDVLPEEEPRQEQEAGEVEVEPPVAVSAPAKA